MRHGPRRCSVGLFSLTLDAMPWKTKARRCREHIYLYFLKEIYGTYDTGGKNMAHK